MKLLLLIVGIASCLWMPAQTQKSQQKPKHKTRVETRYDNKKNETRVVAEPMVIWEPAYNSVSGEFNLERVDLSVSFSYPGKRISTPKIVTITVFSASNSRPQFDKQRDLFVITDDARYSFHEVELVRSSSQSVPVAAVGGGLRLLVTEVVRGSIPFADFTRISTSQKAEIQIGRRKFKFEKAHLVAFKNLVTLMKEEGLEF